MKSYVEPIKTNYATTPKGSNIIALDLLDSFLSHGQYVQSYSIRVWMACQLSLREVNYSVTCSVILPYNVQIARLEEQLFICASLEIPVSSLMLTGMLKLNPLSTLFVKNISEFPKVLSLHTTYTLFPYVDMDGEIDLATLLPYD